MDSNRTVVDAVIPPRQSNGARQRDTKAPCGYNSRKPVRPVGTGIQALDNAHNTAKWAHINDDITLMVTFGN